MMMKLASQVVFDQSTSVEEWENVGHRLGGYDRQLPWAIADYLAFGEDTYHDATLRAVDIFSHMSTDRIGRLTRLGQVFPPERRRWDLAAAMYQEVLRVADDEAEELLDLAHELGWNRDELRAEIKIRKALAKPLPDKRTLDSDTFARLETYRRYHQRLRSLGADDRSVTLPRSDYEILAEVVPNE